MKTLGQRLWWAVFGHRALPWPPPPPPFPEVLTQAALKNEFHNQLPGGVLSKYQQDHLRGSISLAAQLLAPHFQVAAGEPSHVFSTQTQWGIFDVGESGNYGTTEYPSPDTASEEIELLLSGAAWLAKTAGVVESVLKRIVDRSVADVYHP